MLRDVPVPGDGREALVDRMVAVAERLRRRRAGDVGAALAPELAMVYIAERLGTSQQMLIDALAGGSGGPGGTAACAPATRASWPPWCC